VLSDNDLSDDAGRAFLMAMEQVGLPTLRMRKLILTHNRMSAGLETMVSRLISKAKRVQQRAQVLADQGELWEWQRTSRSSVADMTALVEKTKAEARALDVQLMAAKGNIHY
jgi:hypothetical protein